MQIPGHIFYLLRIAYFGRNQDDDLSIDDFLYFALLSIATGKLDRKSDGSPSHVYLDRLSADCRARVKNYRTILMMASIRPPSEVRNRIFILEEYLALLEVDTLISVSSELSEKNTLETPEVIHQLGQELESVFLPQLEGCYKRANNH